MARVAAKRLNGARLCLNAKLAAMSRIEVSNMTHPLPLQERPSPQVSCEPTTSMVPHWPIRLSLSCALLSGCLMTNDEYQALRMSILYADGDGYVSVEYPEEGGQDCDDTDPETRPGAEEVCDYKDNDCDGDVDEGVSTWYPDGDGDGYGDSSGLVTTCSPPADYVNRPGDCDDDEPTVNPGEEEICNDYLDNNCDGSDGGCGWDSEIGVAQADGVIEGAAFADGFAARAASSVDIDFDGHADLVVAAPESNSGAEAAGRVYLFHGPVSGTVTTEAADWELQGQDLSGGLGESVAAGSEPGDDHVMVLVSAREFTEGLVFEAPLSGDATPADAVSVLSAPEGSHVNELIFAGDLNTDTYGDALGSSGKDDTSATDAGTAWVFSGPLAQAGETITPSFSVYGEAEGDEFGTSAAGATDLDGDGIDDFIVGAPHSDRGGADSGTAYVFYDEVSSAADADASEDAFLGVAMGGSATSTRMGRQTTPWGSRATPRRAFRGLAWPVSCCRTSRGPSHQATVMSGSWGMPRMQAWA